MKTLSYFEGLAKESYEEAKPKRLMYAEIDKHRLGKWTPSPALSKLPFIQGHNFSSTQPADALDAGARTFATMMPKITITPLDTSQMAYEDAEKQETVLDWHLKRMNMWGRKSTHWKMLENAMYYCGVAFETEYLPFKYKGKKDDPRIKQLLNGSACRWTVHPFPSVSPLFSQYSMEAYTLTKSVNLQQVIYEYGQDNPGVQKIVSERFGGKTPTAQDLLNAKFTLVKVTDWKERAIWLTTQQGDAMNETFSTKDGITLLHEEHGLDFIPCVVADNEDPILKNAINTGLLDNLNNMRLINFCLAVKFAAMPQIDVTSADGTLRDVRMDQTNPLQPLSHTPSTKVDALPQPQPPQGMREKEMQLSDEVASSTVAKILADANRLMGSESFSQANLAFTIALGSLSLARDAAERAYEMGLYQMYQWIDHAGDQPLIGYRSKKSENGARGETIMIQKGEFDLSSLYIDVALKEFSMLDKQAKVNLAITEVERLGYSRAVVAEELGDENYELHVLKRGEEDLIMAKVQAAARKIMADAEAYAAQVTGAAQLQVQMAMQQQQQPQGQPPPAPGQQVADMNASSPLMEGADMRGGGMSSAPANPMENRESIQGLDAGGNPLV